jgi:ATP-dependent DNA ligase
MLAQTSDTLPVGPYVYEPKWDGWRASAVIDEYGSVVLRSRRGTLLDTFPEISHALFDALPPLTAVDLELVHWSQGRLDFGALGRRYAAGRRRAREMAAAEPMHAVLFDVLFVSGEDVRSRPLLERRRLLEELMAPVPAAYPLALTPQTDNPDQAREWLDVLPAVGCEGVMVKRVDERYEGGKRRWQKVKAVNTDDLVIGAIVGSIDHPDRLVLGRPGPDGTLRIAAVTGPLTPQASAELAAAVKSAGPDHPWPTQIRTGWVREPTLITRVEPSLVAEIVGDATGQGRLYRHMVRFVRLRPDLDAGAVDPVPE